MTPSKRAAQIVEILRQQGWADPVTSDDPRLQNVELEDLIILTIRLETLVKWLLPVEDTEETPPAQKALMVAMLRHLRGELATIKNGARSALLDPNRPGRNSLGSDPVVVRLKLAIGVHAEAFAAAYPDPAKNASPCLKAIATAIQAGGHKMAPRTVGHHIAWFEQGRKGELHPSEWGKSEGWIAEFWLGQAQEMIAISGLENSRLSDLASLTRQASEVSIRLRR